ncbi:MAG: hypothetical protein MHM6MM_003779, partial [Cercozoa sp. M6MM]
TCTATRPASTLAYVAAFRMRTAATPALTRATSTATATPALTLAFVVFFFIILRVSARKTGQGKHLLLAQNGCGGNTGFDTGNVYGGNTGFDTGNVYGNGNTGFDTGNVYGGNTGFDTGNVYGGNTGFDTGKVYGGNTGFDTGAACGHNNNGFGFDRNGRVGAQIRLDRAGRQALIQSLQMDRDVRLFAQQMQIAQDVQSWRRKQQTGQARDEKNEENRRANGFRRWILRCLFGKDNAQDNNSAELQNLLNTVGLLSSQLSDVMVATGFDRPPPVGTYGGYLDPSRADVQLAWKAFQTMLALTVPATIYGVGNNNAFDTGTGGCCGGGTGGTVLGGVGNFNVPLDTPGWTPGWTQFDLGAGFANPALNPGLGLDIRP